jgi:L-rhamnose mutarotase
MTTDDLERAVYLQRIDPERTDEYAAAHDDVPPGVTDAMERGGVERFQLFVRGDIAVCILEVHNVEEYVETVADDPDVAAWERHVAQFKREGVDPNAPAGEAIPFMEEVWSFDPDDD